jgi:hypothetical protein
VAGTLEEGAVKEVYIKGCMPAPELEDASPDAEIWGLNSQRKNPPPRATRWFQLHGLGHMRERHGEEYFRWLAGLKTPVYLFEEQIARWFFDENMPRDVNLISFPVEQTCRPEFGGGYKTNTIDWLMALAMAEGFERIHLVGLEYGTDSLWKSRRMAASLVESAVARDKKWQSELLELPEFKNGQIEADLRGVCVGDVAGDESWARCSIEYYIGLAQGRGIEVTWNEGSGLMVNHHGGRYGLDCAGNE